MYIYVVIIFVFLLVIPLGDGCELNGLINLCRSSLHVFDFKSKSEFH